MKWNRDCRSFPGTYACDIMTAENYLSCEECKFYDKITKKILILKLGAMGDVIRTTTILPALKKKYGQAAKITWVVAEESKELLKGNKYIDQVLVYNQETILRLSQEKYDILLSLEVAPPATLVANKVKAGEKYGYYFNEDGHPSCFNNEAKQYLETVFSNKVNLQAKKTYQEMIFEVADLSYENQEYILNLDDNEVGYGKNLIKSDKKVIGINVGAGGRWSSKSWHPSRIIELVKEISKKDVYEVILLGGKKEEDAKKEIASALLKAGIKVLQNNSANTAREFMSVINACDLIITNDSLALHIAIGLKKKTIALFFVTAPWQIETYGRVKIISSKLLEKHFMDDQYHENLIKSIPVEEVLKSL